VYLNPAIVRMDTGMMNDEPFLGFVGIGGYDAYTAHRFASIKKRTFKRYVRIALDSYKAVAPLTFKVTVYPPEGSPYTYTAQHTAFSVLNISQFGNRMTPAPGERVDDGVFSLCTLVHPPAWYIPVFAFKMFARTIGEGDRYSKRKRAVRVILERETESIAQIDGEPAYAPPRVEIYLRPRTLNVMVPREVKDRV
jgi:diacylglycerol kinase family enzyme